jgi:hypothetical protein
VSAYWIRLADAPDPDAPPPPPVSAADVFPRHRFVWFSDAVAAWRFAVSLLVGSRAMPVIAVPADASAGAVRTLAEAGARAVAVDLDADSGAVAWGDIGCDACVVDHRHGIVRPPMRPTPLSGGPAVAHDLTEILGAHRDVFEDGDVGVVRMGQPPYRRSSGAVVVAPEAVELTSGSRLLDARPAPGDGSDRARPFEEDVADALDWTEACRAASAVYHSAFRPLAAAPRCVPDPQTRPRPAQTSFLVLVRDPDGLREWLRAHDIESERPAAGPLNRGPAGLPGARAFYRRALRLPNHPSLGMGELLYVADAVRRFLEGRPPAR